MSALRCVAAALALGAMLLAAGCGNSVESAFANCVAAAEKQAKSGARGSLPPELVKMFEQAAHGLAEKQCSVIRDECRDPQSDICQHLIRQYGSK